jgi:hypothetical protein
VLTSEHGSDGDSFLTELDGRLRAIQADLRPGVAVPTLSARAIEGETPADRRGRSGPLSILLARARPDPVAADAEPRAQETQPETPSRNPDPPSSETAELLAEVKVLTETQTRLIAASERLLEAFAHTIESPSHSPPQSPSPSETASPPGLFTPTSPPLPSAGIEIAAGPFADTEALRQFERALEQLDAVRRVTVRGYEGSDRAILDVELAR